MSKTIYEWYSELPDHIRDKALKNARVRIASVHADSLAKEFDKAGVSSKSDLTYVKVVLLILASAGSVTTAWNFKSMVTGFLNPEYGAMQQLTELVLHLSAK